MTISKNITELEHSRVKLTVSLEKDQVRAEYDKVLTEYSKNLQIPGFRKGKVPKDVIIRKTGSALNKEIAGRIFQESLEQIFKDEDFPKDYEPMYNSGPKLDGELPNCDPNEDFSYSVEYDVMPRFTIGKWQGLEVEVPSVEIKDEDIDQELDILRRRNAFVLDKAEDAGAALNDVVTVNYSELDEAGNVIADSEREDFVFTLGSGHNIFRFDDDLVGMKKGETRDITKTYPEDFQDKELAGATKRIRVRITSIKEEQLPALDDEFAQDVDEKYNTLADLRNSIRERLTKTLEARLREVKLKLLIKQILDATPIDFPETLVNMEMTNRWENYARRYNTTVDEAKKQISQMGSSWQDIEKEWRKSGNLDELKRTIVLSKLAKDRNIDVSPDEFNKFIEQEAARSGASVEDLTAYIRSSNLEESMHHHMLMEKVNNLLLAENTVKVGATMDFNTFITTNPDEIPEEDEDDIE